MDFKAFLDSISLIGTLISTLATIGSAISFVMTKKDAGSRMKVVAMAAMLFFALLGIICLGLLISRVSASSQASASSTQIPSTSPSPSGGTNSTVPSDPTPTSQPAPFPQLHPRYIGEAHNITLNIIAQVVLTVNKQNQDKISGFCSVEAPLGGSGPFTGTIDAAGHVNFTIQANDGSGTTTVVNGTLQPDGSLTGTYTVENPVSQGEWFATPV